MRNKKVSTSKNSLRLLMFFLIVVVLLITISIIYRFIALTQNSVFDSDYLFTIAFVKDRNLDIVGINARDKKLSHLQLRGVKDLTQAKQLLGIFINGQINLAQTFQGAREVDSHISDALLKKRGVSTSLTFYDLLRLFLVVKGIPRANISQQTISLPQNGTIIDDITRSFFVDPKIVEDNVTIEIRNGTSIPGLGKRLERAITTMGGTVISVTNADKIVTTSQIEYREEKKNSDTLKRLQRLLLMPAIPLSSPTLSDIIITIGKDRVKEINY